MERIVVTGSLIPTADTQGAQPVTVLDTQVIREAGTSDVLATLKTLSPVFRGNGNIGQEVNNGGGGESYLAIHNLSTLVLINGRRLGNSAFSNGGVVDVNTIPLAAIERIEVLTDGASAIYGSQAVGGVVNIITKKNYGGVEIGGRYGGATGEGQYREWGAAVVGGTGDEKSSFTAAVQYYHRDPLLSTDRDIAHLTYEQQLARNSWGSSALSPSFPGKVQDSTGAYLLRGSPLLKGTPEYDPTVTTPIVLPGQQFSGPTAVADYIAAVTATGQQSPYVPIAPDLYLNTPDFGTHSIQGQDRFNAYGSGSYDLFEKQVVIYGDFLYANITSQGELAPSPVTGLALRQSNINVPADNPYNPFGIDLGPQGASTVPRVRSRFVDFGNRIFENQTDFYHVVGGLKGDFEKGFGYDVAYTYIRYDMVNQTENAVNGAALDLALKPSQNPAFAALGLSQLESSAGPVPIYNIFSAWTGSNDPRTIDAIRTTLFNTGISEEWDVTGIIRGAPVALPAGDFAFAAGTTVGDRSLEVDYDGLTEIGKVPGLNPAEPTSGSQNYWAIFGEFQIPITSPEMDIAALNKFDATVALRHEQIDPGGGTTVPKVAARWQPLNDDVVTWAIRGNYGQSFIAPTTYQLYGGAAGNVPLLGVPLTPGPGATVANRQEFTANTSNDQLTPITAQNWGLGTVITPKALENLTVTVDYYNIKTENDIYRMSAQSMVDDLNANGEASQWRDYYRKADGTRVTGPMVNQVNDETWGLLEVPILNGASQETDGLDVTVSYRLQTEGAGTFTPYANANVIFNYSYTDPIDGGPYNYEGSYTDAANGVPGAQGLLPKYLINAGISWELPIGFDALTTTVNFNYVPETEDYFTFVSPDDWTVNGQGYTMGCYYRLDLQLAYEFGKTRETKNALSGTRVAVGIQNLTDQEPKFIISSFEDNTDKVTYDIIGRFVYFELSKKF